MFKELERIGYYNYLIQSGLHLSLNVDLKNYVEALKIENIDLNSAFSVKIRKDIWQSVNPLNNIPFQSKWMI